MTFAYCVLDSMSHQAQFIARRTPFPHIRSHLGERTRCSNPVQKAYGYKPQQQHYSEQPYHNQRSQKHHHKDRRQRPPKAVFTYLFEGEKLYLQEVFIIVLTTLKTLAEYPADDIVSPFASSAEDIDAKMSFLPSEHAPTIPALKYRDVTGAVKQIPGYMLDNGMFAELVILFMVGEVEVGTGLIEQGGSDSEGRIAHGSQVGRNVSSS